MNIGKNKSRLALIMAVYLAGIFMGALDTGIVTPAREIIQNNFGVDSKTGIWMITIYTLAYAASIPIMGKLADRLGRKTIYLTSITLFGIGSLLCGLTHLTDSFWFLVGARAIQAIGGGGIMPIATAEFGTSFPQEKRGMALGLVGAIYGIANIFGSLAGSAILDIFGTQNWEFIFYVNVPITVFIIIAGILALPNNRDEEAKNIDVVGILVVTAMVLSLLYGLKNIDFFDFAATVTSVSVYPYLIAFIVLLPVLILVERKAQDPVLNLKYFTSLRIVVALVVAFVAGFVLMGIVFIPQFCENALKVPAGSGGYFTMILALLSGVSAMASGRMLDKIGAKRVLQLGFAISIAGALFLYFVAAQTPNVVTVVASLMLLGLGLGFTMGAPINYMMLENIADKEASSGLATLSLIRSIGTTIAPAIMVGFIAHAGMSLQTTIMGALPSEMHLKNLPYVQEISDTVKKLQSNSDTAAILQNVELPKMEELETLAVDFNRFSGMGSVSGDMLQRFQASDVTTVAPLVKEMATNQLKTAKPMITGGLQQKLQKSIDEISAALENVCTGAEVLGELGENSDCTCILVYGEEMEAYKAELTTLVNQLKVLHDELPAAVEAACIAYVDDIDSYEIENTYQSTLNSGYKSMYLVVTAASVAALIMLIFYKKREKAETT